MRPPRQVHRVFAAVRRALLVCRAQATGVQQAFTPPSRFHFEAITKDRGIQTCRLDSGLASTSHDKQHSSGGFKRGWFEDFGEFDEQNDEGVRFGTSGGPLLPKNMIAQHRALMSSFPFSTHSRGTNQKPSPYIA